MMKNRIYILILIIFYINLSCFSQKSKYDKSVLIGGFQTTKFYAEEFNALAIVTHNYPIKSLVIKASQGNLNNIDSTQNGFLSLTNLKVGTVAIDVFNKVDTGLLLLNRRLFKVIKRPLTEEEKNTLKLNYVPKVSIAGYIDSIPSTVLNKVTKIDINDSFRIMSLTFLLYTRKKNVYDGDVFFQLESGEFDNNVRSILRRIQPNCECGIALTDIKAIDLRGKICSLPSVVYKFIY